MQKKYKIFLTVIVIIILLLSGITVYMKYFRDTSDKTTNKSNIVNNIEKFGYTLDDRDSKLMKGEFENLKKILEVDEIDYNEYAKSISKLFIIDLYTIDNKINKYDVGSLEYLVDSEKDKFKNIIIDSIYANLEDDSNHNRNQELPIVKEVNVNNITKSTFNYNKESVESFDVEISWDYEKDMGYDTNAKLILIKDNEKLSVVEYNPIIEEEVVE